MTLNQYITTLVSLRDRYNAGDFTMRVQEISTENDPNLNMIVKQFGWSDIDGDDFWLNLETHTCNIACKTKQAS